MDILFSKQLPHGSIVTKQPLSNRHWVLVTCTDARGWEALLNFKGKTIQTEKRWKNRMLQTKILTFIPLSLTIIQTIYRDTKMLPHWYDKLSYYHHYGQCPTPSPPPSTPTFLAKLSKNCHLKIFGIKVCWQQ